MFHLARYELWLTIKYQVQIFIFLSIYSYDQVVDLYGNTTILFSILFTLSKSPFAAPHLNYNILWQFFNHHKNQIKRNCHLS